MTGPYLLRWDAYGLVPAGSYWEKRCRTELVPGRNYQVEIIEERSAASHRHYFAALNEGWANLPHDLAGNYPSPEHLRKMLLIRSGFRDERSIVCSSKAEALRLASFIQPMDDFAVVSTNGPVVIVWTAKSQSQKAMGKKVFGESKNEVLRVLAEMIGVTREQLERAADGTGNRVTAIGDPGGDLPVFATHGEQD